MKRLWRKWKFYRHLRRLGHLASHRESWELAEANLLYQDMERL